MKRLFPTLAGTGGIALSALLAGCAGPATRAIDALADKPAYLAANFTADQTRPEVRQSITAVDHAPLGFRKMTVKMHWQTTYANASQSHAEDKTMVMINGGGGLVERMSEDSRNGIPISQEYDLSYRAVLPLRSQTVNEGATYAGPIYETKSLGHVDSINDLKAGEQASFEMKSGTVAQVMKFRDHRFSCSAGKDYPASTVLPRLQGAAMDLDCTSYNANGVESGKSHTVFFRRYGISIMLSSQNSAGIAKATLKSIDIE